MADLLIEMGLEKSDTALSSFCVAIGAAYSKRQGGGIEIIAGGDRLGRLVRAARRPVNEHAMPTRPGDV